MHKIFNAKYVRSEMDASALIDHTILHELTHALSKGDTDDVKGMRSYGKLQFPVNPLKQTF